MSGERPRAEEDRLPSRPIIVVVVATVLFTLALVLAAWLVNHAREGQMRPSRDFSELRLGPPHKVAAVRGHAFDTLNESAERNGKARAGLASYRWVDRSRGLVQIPIERAIDLVAGGGGP